MDWLKLMIQYYESSEEVAEKELRMAVEDKRWSEVRRLAQNLREYRTTRLALASALERIEKDNQKEVL